MLTAHFLLVLHASDNYLFTKNKAVDNQSICGELNSHYILHFPQHHQL